MATTKSKAAAKEKAAAETDNTELAIDGIAFEADSNSGLEGTDKDSFATPFLRILHSQSPQCNEADSAYIEGAKGGMFHESVSGKIFSGTEGIIILPCAFERRFVQWAPRGGDGSYKGDHLPEEVAAMRAAGKITEVEGKLLMVEQADEPASDTTHDRLVDTRSHYVILLNEETGGGVPCLFTLSSTQIKKSKQLMSLLSAVKVKSKNGLVTPPTWLNRIRATTVPENNKHGAWHGVKFEPDGFVKDPILYNAGKAFYEAVKAGEIKTQVDAEGAGGTESTGF